MNDLFDEIDKRFYERRMQAVRRQWDYEETRGGIIHIVVTRMHAYRNDTSSLAITDNEFKEFLAPIFVKEQIDQSRRQFHKALMRTGLTRRDRVRLRAQFERIVAEREMTSSS